LLRGSAREMAYLARGRGLRHVLVSVGHESIVGMAHATVGPAASFSMETRELGKARGGERAYSLTNISPRLGLGVSTSTTAVLVVPGST
jgi:hypothetical protein